MSRSLSRAGGVAQAVESLPSKREALTLSPNDWKKKKRPYLKNKNNKHQWLTPIILAIQEAEIRRIVV
jgi:hypothetical protein